MKTLLLDALGGLHGRRGPILVAASGLMLAMSACLLVALLAIALSSTDPAIPDPEQVVLLDMKGNPPGQPSPWFTASPASFADMLKQRKVPLDLISRAVGNGMDIENAGRLTPAYLIIADPDLVSVLGLETLHGDLRATLNQRDGIAITEDLARKLWGELPLQDGIGKRIESRGVFYTVTAILPNVDPRSPLSDANPMVGDAIAMVGYETQGNVMSDADRAAIYMINARVFARLRPGVSADQVGGWMREAFMANPLYAQLPAEWKANREAAYFRGITLAQLPFEGAGNELRWRLLGAVAAASALLLTLAAFNFMNLQTANLLQRQRETALRRSLGADGRQLVHLWAVETALPLLLSAAGALLLAWWLAPVMANWIGLSPKHPVADPVPRQVLFGLLGAVIVLLPLILALPALTALRRAPAPALQGRTASEGPWGRRLRQILLTLQLGGATLLLSLAGVLAIQQDYLLHADRGFDTRNRLWLGVMVNPDFVPNMDAFLAALDRHPAVNHWAFSNARPARETRGIMEMHVSASQHKQVLRVTTVSPGFFATYGMTLLAGTPRVGTGEAHIVIDAKAARLLGFANPNAAVGQTLRGGGGFMQEGTDLRRIVAVVKDVKLESAREPALPQAFLLTDKPQWDLSISGTDFATLRAAVEELWKLHGPQLNYAIESADSQRAAVYRQEQQLTTMLAAIAVLAAGVAMVGVYALVADTLRRRRTELVLHRLHGASHAAIARQVTTELAPPLFLAAALGLPLGFWLGEKYLHDFVDRGSVAIGLVLPLVVASGATLLITTLAAARHIRRAVTLQPIEALR
jgi:ABC-type lipoprotein release transport system permease subunit